MWQFFWLTLGALVAIVLSMVPSFALGVLIDTAFAAKSLVQLAIVLGALVCSHVVEVFVVRACTRRETSLNRDCTERLKDAFIEEVERAPLAALEAKPVATLLSRMRSIERIVRFYVHWYVLIASRPVFFLAAILCLIIESGILGAVILLMTAIYVRLYWLASRTLRMQFMKESERADAAAHALHEFAQGLVTLKIAGRILSFYRSQKERAGEANQRAAQGDEAEPLLVQLTESYARVAFIAVLGLGAWLVIDGKLSVGHLVIVNVIFRRILGETRLLISRIRRYYRTRAATEIVGTLLDELRQVAETAPARGTVPGFRHIELREVAFRYPNAKAPVLEHVNLRIEQGQFVVLVGASGSGKTSLLKLIAGLYMPSSGKVVYLDGDEPQRYAFVSPGDMLFDRSVHQNIALHGNASRATVIEAAMNAGAHSFIEQLAQGYDTRLRSQARGLSQGQKQKISLARCLAANAPLMLLDEPTSALDPQSEQRFLENLQRIRAGKTIVMVTHRPAPAMVADVVAVIEGGRLREVGPPARLLADAGSAFSRWCQSHAEHVVAQAKAPSSPVDSAAALPLL